MKIIPVLLLVLGLTYCKSKDSSNPDQIPEGCEDPAAYSVHLQRKAHFERLTQVINGARRRAPMEPGEAVKGDDILGITLIRGSDSYISVFAYFSKADRATFSEVQSDALDACYAGLSYGEYKFSDDQVNQLNAALHQTKRVEGKAPPCQGEWMGSNWDIVDLYYKDSTVATYIVNRTKACADANQENIPLISEDFFEKHSAIRETITDTSSPYQLNRP